MYRGLTMLLGIAFICFVGTAVAQAPPVVMLRSCAEKISMTPDEVFSLKASEAFAALGSSATPNDVIDIVNATMSETLGCDRTMEFFTCIRDFIAQIFTDCSLEAEVTDEQKDSVKAALETSFDRFKTLTKEEADAAKGEMQKQITDILGEEKAAKLQTCIEAKFQKPSE